jgi:porphobilinogen deaminase
MSKPEELTAPDADAAMAGNMDLIIAAHAVLKRLGYEQPEIMDLLSTAHFLAGGDASE